MNKLTFVLLSLYLCSITFLQAQPNIVSDPQPLQYAVVINYTATWCPHCGRWGADLIHKWDSLERVVAITAHSSHDPMHIATLYNEMAYYHPIGAGIPSFIIGDISSTEDQDLQDLLSRDPEAGVNFIWQLTGDSIYVKVKIMFFKETNGEYWVNVLALEDYIDGGTTARAYKQSGTNKPNYTHDFVMRGSATGNFHGNMIPTQTFKAGDSMEAEMYITPTSDANLKNIYPIAIIWKKQDDKFIFVNAMKHP